MYVCMYVCVYIYIYFKGSYVLYLYGVVHKGCYESFHSFRVKAIRVLKVRPAWAFFAKVLTGGVSKPLNPKPQTLNPKA